MMLFICLYFYSYLSTVKHIFFFFFFSKWKLHWNFSQSSGCIQQKLKIGNLQLKHNTFPKQSSFFSPRNIQTADMWSGPVRASEASRGHCSRARERWRAPEFGKWKPFFLLLDFKNLARSAIYPRTGSACAKHTVLRYETCWFIFFNAIVQRHS